MPAVGFLFIGVKPLRCAALQDRRVVGVRHQRAARMHGMRVPDHREQRPRLLLAVDYPVGVEDLVPAMLGVRLREHGELGIRGVAPEAAKGLLEVLQLVFAQGKPEPQVRLRQLRQPDELQRTGDDMLEQARCILERLEHGFGHAVVQQRGDFRAAGIDVVSRTPLDAPHAREAAVARDVGRLGRPRRDGAEPGHDEKQRPVRRLRRRAVFKQPLEDLRLALAERARHLDEVPEPGRDGANAGVEFLQRCEQLGEAELRNRARSPEAENLGH